MDNNYLLTYLKDGVTQFSWFESQEEMQLFIDTTEIEKIFDAVEVLGTRDLDINFKTN